MVETRRQTEASTSFFAWPPRNADQQKYSGVHAYHSRHMHTAHKWSASKSCSDPIVLLSNWTQKSTHLFGQDVSIEIHGSNFPKSCCLFVFHQQHSYSSIHRFLQYHTCMCLCLPTQGTARYTQQMVCTMSNKPVGRFVAHIQHSRWMGPTPHPPVSLSFFQNLFLYNVCSL